MTTLSLTDRLFFQPDCVTYLIRAVFGLRVKCDSSPKNCFVPRVPPEGKVSAGRKVYQGRGNRGITERPTDPQQFEKVVKVGNTVGCTLISSTVTTHTSSHTHKPVTK